MELKDSITTIKGVGDKTSSVFARLGIYTVQDLLLYYPRTFTIALRMRVGEAAWQGA